MCNICACLGQFVRFRRFVCVKMTLSFFSRTGFSMQLSKLRALSSNACWNDYVVGKLTRFECMFRDFLSGEIDWPQYQPADVVALRKRHHLTQEGLAALLRVSPKSVMRWETAGEAIPTPVHIALCAIDRLGDGVFDLMKGESSFVRCEKSHQTTSGLVKGSEFVRFDVERERRRLASDVPSPFTHESVKELRARLRLTKRAFAEALGVSPSTVDKWESGAVVPQGSAQTLLKILWQQGLQALPK